MVGDFGVKVKSTCWCLALISFQHWCSIVELKAESYYYPYLNLRVLCF
uniref:Uncharacterized protein n=1 Tax=Rhizophora mucronata TaxID=61149 RepID=A0A2P2N0Z1_RHIMU